MPPVATDPGGNPELASYVEKRFDLLTAALESSLEAIRISLAVAERVASAALTAADLRYQQRFEGQQEASQAAQNAQQTAMAAALVAQQQATATAFQASEKAMTAALTAAKEAVNAALAAADRAVTKTETTADTRFAERAKLTGQQFITVEEKIKALVEMNNKIESRLNTSAGEAAGNQCTRDGSGAAWMLGISLLALITSVVIGVLALVLSK